MTNLVPRSNLSPTIQRFGAGSRLTFGNRKSIGGPFIVKHEHLGSGKVIQIGDPDWLDLAYERMFAAAPPASGLSNLKVQNRWRDSQGFAPLVTFGGNSMPTGGKMLAFDIRISGPLVISSGTAGSFLDESQFARLVQSINMNVTPIGAYLGGPYVSVMPAAAILRRMQISQNNGMFRSELPGFGATDSPAAGTYNLNIVLSVIFADPNFARKVDFAVNLDSAASYQIQVQTQGINGAGVVTGNTTTWNTSGLSVECSDRRIFAAGDTHEPFFEDHVILITGAVTNWTDKSMPNEAGQAFSDILLIARTGAPGSAQTPANTILSQLQLFGPGVVIDSHRYAPSIQADAYRDGYLNPASTMTTGFFPSLMSPEGWESQMPDCSTLQNLIDYANPSGSGNDVIEVTTRRNRPIPGGAVVSAVYAAQQAAAAAAAAKQA